jgi:hypothetical protein
MKIGIFVLLFISQIALAEEIKLRIVSAIKNSAYDLGVGSKVKLEFIQRNEVHHAIFVGKLIGHPKYGEELLFLDEKDTRIFMIDSKSVRSPSVAKSRIQNLISTIDQAGETCAAYALYHFWQQTAAVGYVGNGELITVMSKEHTRMKLLEESITRYYMGRSFSIKPIMKNFGDRFGFKCQEKVFQNSAKAIDYIYKHTLNGKSIIMEFFIGPKMVTSDIELQDFETKVEMDPRLWIPRKVGERNAGGHAIVASAAFTLNGKKKIVVLDSNWNEPRIWDMEAYLGGKTALNEMIFHSCD